ncbi:MAG: translocation protein TolB [Bdellovibrionales bacterium]
MRWIFSFLLLLSFQTFAQAPSGEIYIKLGEARTKKSLLALPVFQNLGTSRSSSDVAIGNELFKTLTNDLEVSTYFQFLDPAGFLEDVTNKGLRPVSQEPNGFNFASWQQLKADFLIRAGYSVTGNDLHLEAYLYHVPKASLVFGKKYKTNKNAARKMAHTFANDIMKALTGEEGMYLSRIVVASDKGVAPAREIFVMDWDGANFQKISNHRSIALSPAWSADSRKIAYTAYVKRGRNALRNADLFLFDVATEKREAISFRMGLNSGASFAPDNRHIFLTISQGTSPDIYKIDYNGEIVSKITKGPAGAMNVEPAVSRDGRRIAFSSDRAGRTMIYTMNTDGSDVKRITFAGQFNASPAWSPDGKKIAFAGQTGTNFDVFVMEADGNNMIRLTSANRPNGKPANNEDPTWSPDGRFVMYTSDRTGRNQIFISTPDGLEERQITKDTNNYFKPKWSSNL